MDVAGYGLGLDAQAASEYGEQLTSSASVNTDGAIVQLHAATPFDADGLIIQLGRTSAANSQLVDLLIGANPNEHPILPDMLYNAGVGPRDYQSVYVPRHVSEGSRLSARNRANIASSVIRIGVVLCRAGLGLPSFGNAIAIGSTPSTSLGTVVDPGATINTKGAWVALTTSMPLTMRWLLLMLAREDATMTSQEWRLDIGRGASPNQYVICPDLLITTASSSDDIGPKWWSIPLYCPEGDSLWVRCQSSLATAAERELRAAGIVFG